MGVGNLWVVACAVTSLAAAVPGQSFSIGAVDASGGTVGGGAPGTGIDIIGGTIYQDAFGGLGSTGEPTQAFIDLFPTLQNLEYDTYLTIDSGPVEPAPGYDGSGIPAASEASGSPGFSASGYRGIWFVTGPFIPAYLVEKPGFGSSFSIFLGRITHTGTLEGRIRVAISEPGDVLPKNIEGDISSDVNPFAIDFIGTDTGGTPLDMAPNYAMAFVKKEFQVDIDGTTFTVSDIHLQALFIPAPAGVAPLALLGLAATRRRRG